ncbi:MAG: nucleotidyltransferase family protein [Acidobacteriaceae bacterium]|nr:nucleotidyltransferase family protein [Acidobacteriaceae bacterium]
MPYRQITAGALALNDFSQKKYYATSTRCEWPITAASHLGKGFIALSSIERTIEQLPEKIPADRWDLYWRVMTEALRRKIRFALGGGLAATAYAGQWRDNKDLDLYIKPEDRDRMIRLLKDLGLEDYYDQKPYDRAWIFRSCRGDTIIDVMWAMANQRAHVDELWLNGPVIDIDGEQIRMLPVEETLWSKLYVLQSDRCDWPDALNILYSSGPKLDWARLLERVADDAPLLGGLLAIFRWLCPEKADEFPAWVWAAVGLKELSNAQGCGPERAKLLDSRSWFGWTLNNTSQDSTEN